MPARNGWARVNVLAFVLFLDILAVGLVIPLLPARLKELGVRPALTGLTSTFYSGAQMLGGVVFAVLGDRGILSRRAVLVVSFAGAAVSYAIVGLAGSVPLLLASRVVVGLLKQSATASHALASECTSSDDRAEAFGRLSSAILLGFTMGQSLGGVLASRVHPGAGPALAVLLYGVDILFVLAALPGRPPAAEGQEPSARPKASGLASLRSVLDDRGLAKVLIVVAAYELVAHGMDSMLIQYEQERYSFTPEQLGFAGTARSVLRLVMQSLVVGRVIRHLQERAALQLALLVFAVAYATDGAVGGSWTFYALVALPARSFALVSATVGFRSLLSRCCGAKGIGTTLAAVDVLQSACGFLAPTVSGLVLDFAGTEMFPVCAAVAYGGLLFLLTALVKVPERADLEVQEAAKAE